MAPAAQGHPPLPPLTVPVGQIVVPNTAPRPVHALAVEWATGLQVPIDEVVLAGNLPLPSLAAGTLYLHPVPDIFGRVAPAPGHGNTITVLHRWAAALHQSDGGAVVRIGGEPPAGLHAHLRALVQLGKQLAQAPGVKRVFDPPPQLGVALVAPDGVVAPDGFSATPETVPGLPDLWVVRPAGFWDDPHTMAPSSEDET